MSDIQNHSVFSNVSFELAKLEAQKAALRPEIERLKALDIPARLGRRDGNRFVYMPPRYRGFCYMISDGMGAVKIGKADCPESRMADLQRGNSRPLALLRCFDGGFAAEKWLHEFYQDRRRSGEWFDYCPTMLRVLPFLGLGEAA